MSIKLRLVEDHRRRIEGLPVSGDLEVLYDVAARDMCARGGRKLQDLTGCYKGLLVRIYMSAPRVLTMGV